VIYLLTAIGLTPGGSSALHIYTQTVHRTTQFTNWEECETVPRLCEVYPGICLTTEERALKNLSQGGRRMPVGTMKTEYTEQSVQAIEQSIQTNYVFNFMRLSWIACPGYPYS
jgi:hypothetical protein